MLVMTFLEVKTEGEDGSKLFQNVARVGTVSALDGCSDELMEFIVIDAAEVRAIGGAEDCIGDVRADFFGDGLGGSLLDPNDGLVDLVDLVGFVLCVSASGDGGEHMELGSRESIRNGV